MNVELIAYTPVPEAVCNLAAETCVSKCIPEMDYGEQKSLGHAMASGHESVLEHANFTFAIEGISRACLAQLSRHRLMSLGVQSQRYVQMAVSARDPFEYVIPESIKNTPGALNMYWKHMMATAEIYGRLVDCYNIPIEDARYILPNACCTNLVVTMNARELRHVLKYRLCNRAQWEIREVAEKMLELAKGVAPSLFQDAGPRCKATGICPEQRSCGKCPRYIDLEEKDSEGGL